MRAGSASKWKTGLCVAAALTVILCIFSVVLGMFSITEAWAGFLFFWFWSAVRKFDLSSLKYDIPNAFAGLLLGGAAAWSYRTLEMKQYEAVVVGLMFLVLVCSITKAMPYIIGDASFLFFTILTGHTMLSEAKYGELFLSYAAGAVFFTIVLLPFIKKMGQGEEKKDQ